MSEVSNVAATLWNFLNFPLITLGKSPITLWIIVLNIFIIIAFVIVSSRLKHWLLTAISGKKGVNVSNWRAAVTLGYYGLITLGLVGILQASGLDLSFFTVLTGAIGIGVGFGMQTIFSNFISGIIILLEKPLKLGDRIDIGDISGNVHSISVRATTVITNDNVSVIVPNSDFITKQVINWSHSGSSIRMSISVAVSYDTDPDLVERILMQVASEEPGVLQTPEPTVRLEEFGESGLKFTLLVWTHEFSDRKGALKSLLNFRVLKAFKLNNIHIPFPQRDIHVHQPAPVKESSL